MTRRNWLITGGCGFIGRRLIAALLASNAGAIRILDNLSVGSLGDLAATTTFVKLGLSSAEWPELRDEVQFIEGDVCDAERLMQAARGMHTLVHLAANTGVGPSVDDPRMDCLTNVVGTLNALEAARHANVRRFVFASSGAPIGEVTPPIHEELAPHPVSPYGASKLAGEGYCSAYARTFALETVALRFGNVYGPGSGHKNSVVAKFIRDSVDTNVLRINGDGSQTRDFVYVDDLVEAILLAADVAAIGGEIFQIATQTETSISEIAELIQTTMPKFGIPAPRLEFAAPRLGDVMRNYSDTSKARQRLGWQARTSLDQGIESTIRWFVDGTSSRNHQIPN
jgi:UDP-glucose 4-epimerase